MRKALWGRKRKAALIIFSYRNAFYQLRQVVNDTGIKLCRLAVEHLYDMSRYINSFLILVELSN